MHVQMEDGLTCAGARVDHGSITAPGESLIVGHARCDAHQVAHCRFIFLRDGAERFDVLARDHEHVDGRLRIGVAESDTLVVLVDGLGRNLTARDSS